MDFGSKFVYNYSDSEEESVSDNELEEGIASVITSVSDDAPAAAVAEESCVLADALCARGSAVVPAPPPLPAARSSASEAVAPPSKLKKLHHWMTGKKGPASKGPTEAVPDMGENNSRSVSAPAIGHCRPQRPQQQQYKKWRRADTNVVAIKFDHLITPSNMHTGDAVICTGCHAILSHISKLTDNGDEKVWDCEFCGVRNPVDLVAEEIPSQLDVTYMLSPAPTTTASGRQGTDESLVVFCVDTSGSMLETLTVPDHMRYRGNHRRDFTRLDAVLSAVDHQLVELVKEHPQRRVALVTFDSDVTVIGDGTGTPVKVTDDKLNNEAQLTKVASELSVPDHISKTRATLAKKLFGMEKGGQTALGPALFIAIAMASQAPGSKVIICTDGEANVGLGKLNTQTDAEYETSSAFYKQLGLNAKDKGVCVSVLTIPGTSCKLVELGDVANITGGQVNIVDPMKLTQEFGNILADPVIATHVVATFLVHSALYIRNEPTKASSVVRDVGSVTMDMEVTFEYGIRHAPRQQKPAEAPLVEDPSQQSAAASFGAEADAAAQQNPAAPPPTGYPFQVQVRYTDLDGAQALRVLTQTKPFTTDRDEAEQHVNLQLLGAHATQQSAYMAQEGNYSHARLNAFSYNRIFHRRAGASDENRSAYDAYRGMIAPMERGLREARHVETVTRGRNLSDDENDDAYDAGGSKPSKQQQRRRFCSDDVASKMYKGSKASSKAFYKK